MRALGTAILLLALALAALWLWPDRAPRPPRETPGRPGTALQALRPPADTTGFARALEPRPFEFPADHGPHPDYRVEWWYVTGDLVDGEGREYGYQLTLFRYALAPPPDPPRPSHWATRQVYMGHLALTRLAERRFQFDARYARAALGLAGARAAPFAVWLEDWRIEQSGDDADRWRLHASAAGGFTLDLELRPQMAPVANGDHGLSRKGAAPGQASYYYSIPRLATTGRLNVDGETRRVQGRSWLDREWSTSSLGPEQTGWDWFALRLADGWSLMWYRLRRDDGSTDPASAGSLVAPDGRRIALHQGDLQLEVLDHWRSPDGVRYPSGWRLRLPRADLELVVEPMLEDQELRTRVRYWEGLVSIRGHHDGDAVGGRGHVELTGYADAPP